MDEACVYDLSLPNAYHNALLALKENGEKVKCDDWDTECLECAMSIFVENPLQEPRISKLFIGGPEELQQYVMEILNGILDFEIYAGNWEYTYHNRMVDFDGIDQIGFVIQELKRNPSSRRAVITIRTSEDIGSSDPACLQHIQYLIRNGKLNCKVLFRSNDAVEATFMNMFALVCLQEYIAKEIGVEVGSYTHRANSFHCYAKDFDKLDGYVKRIENANEDDEYDLCYGYDEEDGWKEMMDCAVEEIAAKVEELKGRTNEEEVKKWMNDFSEFTTKEMSDADISSLVSVFSDYCEEGKSNE